MAAIGPSDRTHQRYDANKVRLVVAAVPYRFEVADDPTSVRVLVVSSSKQPDFVFPKGGWESFESASEGAARETYEEAGVCKFVWRGWPSRNNHLLIFLVLMWQVRGPITAELGSTPFKSSGGSLCILHGFMLRVTEVLQKYPEKSRERRWV